MKLIARLLVAIATPVSSRIEACVTRRTAAAAVAALFFVLCTPAQGSSATWDPATTAASKSLEAKLLILESKDTHIASFYPPVIITEYEANSYLKVHSGEFLPPGVRTPVLSVQPEHLTGATDVDFDQLSRSYPNPNDMGPKILAAMFHGTQHVTVTAKIQSQSAGFTVQIESVVVGSMNVPAWLVDYVVQNVLQPRYGFDLAKPVPYPDHVTQIVLGSGQVTFLRGQRKSQ